MDSALLSRSDKDKCQVCNKPVNEEYRASQMDSGKPLRHKSCNAWFQDQQACIVCNKPLPRGGLFCHRDCRPDPNPEHRLVESLRKKKQRCFICDGPLRPKGEGVRIDGATDLWRHTACYPDPTPEGAGPHAPKCLCLPCLELKKARLNAPPEPDASYIAEPPLPGPFDVILTEYQGTFPAMTDLSRAPRSLTDLCLDVLDHRRGFLRAVLRDRKREASLTEYATHCVDLSNNRGKHLRALKTTLENMELDLQRCQERRAEIQKHYYEQAQACTGLRRRVSHGNSVADGLKKRLRGADEALELCRKKYKTSEESLEITRNLVLDGDARLDQRTREVASRDKELARFGLGQVDIRKLDVLRLDFLHQTVRAWQHRIKDQLFEKSMEAKVLKQTEEMRLCRVCMDANREILFRPCNHVCCCYKCSREVKKCPYCRKAIKGKEKVFL